MEASGPAARARRPLTCSTRRSSRHCAPNTTARRKRKWRRPSSERRCRWCSAAATGARCRLPVSRPCWILPYRPEAPDLPDFGGLDVALVGVPMDLGVTNRAGARFGPRAVRDVERIGPYNHAARRRAECRVQGGRYRRRADALALQPRQLHRGHRGVLSAHPGGRRAAAVGRRRSFDHLSDPEGAWGTTGRSASSISTRIATPWARSTAPNSTMAARSARRCWTACSTPNARSRSASAARPRSSGDSPTTPA